VQSPEFKPQYHQNMQEKEKLYLAMAALEI
jgi:hypothetical protein